jgi:CRISPR/Cas system CSM-associated protein Csm3 (group 7 of RAMP superfamily)
MPGQKWSADTSRRISQRIVVEGDLILQTPAHFGNGDGDDLVDMPLLVDPLDGRTPLLTGASIAGALRSYLRSVERGYHNPVDTEQERTSAAVALFGGARGDDDGEQSPLIVEDALGQSFGVELRDGVRIDPVSRTAEEDKLFNLQLWHAGTTFPLRFELLIREGKDGSEHGSRLKQALATALEGFTNGAITLGARKRRGYGRVNVDSWRVRVFDLTQPQGLLDWLEDKGQPSPDLRQALAVDRLLDDGRTEFRLDATFALDGSLLIRSGGGKDDQGPDMVHLHARQPGGESKPILSGTSLAGTLRARAGRILRALASATAADRISLMVEALFGSEEIKSGMKAQASRLIAEERVIQCATTDLVQNRVGIDRFTGGARETALFNEQPAFGGKDTEVSVQLRVLQPKDHELGLVLLLLKDLWTGDLPLGGESSVGRGRLKGKRALLQRTGTDRPAVWELTPNGAGLVIAGDRAALEGCVKALRDTLQEKRR